MTIESESHSRPNDLHTHERVRRERGSGGDTLAEFEERFNLHTDLVQRIRSWSRDSILRGMYESLIAHTDPKAFLDRYAEAMVASHLQQSGCRFHVDVMTPNGRSADFEVFADGYRFFLHVKRLLTAHRPKTDQLVTSRFRSLENIKRPYVVQIRWAENATDDMKQRIVEGATEFLKRARVGDEFVAHDDANQDIGGLRIVAPWEGKHIKLVIGHPSGFRDDVPRIQKLLKKAAKQFMPGGINVVMLGSRLDRGSEDFENALLGSHIERWDKYPPRGRRVAHGRAADGFWHEGRFDDCQAGSWFKFDPTSDAFRSRLWIRGHLGVPTQVMGRLIDLFHSTGNESS